MFRSSFVDENSNPWSPSSTYIHVGSLQNILKFAEKSGHIDRVSFKLKFVNTYPVSRVASIFLGRSKETLFAG